MASPAAFELTGVTVTYAQSDALRDISLRIAPGEALAVVGPSGSGKTTLLRLLNGGVRPSRGTVATDGRQIADMTSGELRRMRARIGSVHQDLRLVPNVRVGHNVIAGRLGSLSFGASLRAMLLMPRLLQLEAHEILERVGIGEKLHERTDRLSGGEQQRVAIARALFQRPTTILADEPISSVDPARGRDVLQLLTALSRELGLTLCVSLHHLELAREFFPRLIGLRQGRVMFDATPDRVDAAGFSTLYDLSSGSRSPDEP
jgi:phosphonate transport system ATP-binding protein